MLTDATRLADFPGLAEKTYLNTAAEGIPPRAVLDALAQYGQDKLKGMDGRPDHEAHWQSARQRTARVFGLTENEIGICSCSSEAFNLAAMALRPTADDEIIVSDLDFPAGATPWLTPTATATVKVWRHRAGAARIEDLVSLLSPRTRLVCVSAVSFYNGYRINLAQLAETIRKHSNAMLSVDVTQAMCRVPLDLSVADLIISSTHKWLLASHGGGLVGVPDRTADTWTVPAGGWFNLEDAFGDNRFERAVPLRGARSFGVGMPNYPAIYAIDAAFGYIESVGVEAIDHHARPLVEGCYAELKKLPVEMITPDEPEAWAGIIAFKHPKGEQIAAGLREKNIHIMSQAGRLRVAIHGYNTTADIEIFLRTLKEQLADV